MSEIDFLYQLSKKGVLNDGNLISLYKTDAEYYDYDNHMHNAKINEILKTRNIRTDLAHLLHCPEDQIAYLNERLDPGVKYLYTGLHLVNLDTYEVLNGKTVDMKRYLEDEINKEKEKKNTSLIEQCKSNSVGNTIKMYNPVIKQLSKEEIIQKIKVAVKCFSIAAGLTVTIGAISSANNNDSVSKFLNDHRYLVTDEKVRTDDNSGYYYLHGNIAKNVINSDEDKDSLIYAVYNEVKRDASTISGHDERQIDYNMDLIMKDLAFNSNEYQYNNFDEYLVSKHCVNENGKIDRDMYDSMMHEYITKMLTENDYKFDGGKTR